MSLYCNRCLFCHKELDNTHERRFCSQDHRYLYSMAGCGHYLNEFLITHELTIKNFHDECAGIVPLGYNLIRSIVKGGMTIRPISGLSSYWLAKRIERVVFGIDSDGYMWQDHTFDYRLMFREKKRLLKEGKAADKDLPRLNISGGYRSLIDEYPEYGLWEVYEQNKGNRARQNLMLECKKIVKEQQSKGVPLLSENPVKHVSSYCKVFPSVFNVRLAYYLTNILPVKLDYRQLLEKTNTDG